MSPRALRPRSIATGSRARGTEARRVKHRLTAISLFLLVTTALAGAREGAPWQLRWTARPLTQAPAFLCFSPDMRRLVTGARARWLTRTEERIRTGPPVLALLDGASGRLESRVGLDGDELVAVAFTASDALTVVMNRADGAQTWTEVDGRNGKRVRAGLLLDPATSGPDRGGAAGVFSPDGRRFAAHHGRVMGLAVPPLHFVGQTVVWDTATWQVLASIPVARGGDGPMPGFTADGMRLADSPLEYGNRDEAVRHDVRETVSRLALPLYRLDGETQRAGVVHVWGPQPSAALSPRGDRLVASVTNNAEGSLVCWEIDGGRQSEPLMHALDSTPRPSRTRSYTAVAWSPDGAWIAAGLSDGTLRLWDARTQTLVQEMPALSSPVSALQFSGNAQRLAVGLQDGRVQVWDAAGKSAGQSARP